MLNTYKYDAWGVILNEVEEFDNPYKYAGYYYDLETSNYYLLSRYYNPSIVRFISEDTYKGELDDPLSLNRYVYVHNNPLIYYDPDGYAPIPIITGGIGGLFGLGTTFVQDMLDDWKINTNLGTYLGNTVQGTTTGFGLGLCGTTCGGIGGFVGDFANQYINKGKVDLSQSLISGLTTYATSGVFNVGGPVTSTGFNYVKDCAVKGFVAGTTGDVVYQLLSKGVTRDGYGQAAGYNPLQAVENYSLGQTLKTGAAGAIMAPVGAKIVESSIDKFGPYSKFDLNNPESFRDAKFKDVEKYMDKNLEGKDGFVKKSIKKGNGVRYFNEKGGNYRLNYGYDKPITEGADNVHLKPYLTTTVGSRVVRIPLK